VKKIGEYTTRGSVSTDDLMNRIILDDGSFKTGYRVVEFIIAQNDMDESSTTSLTAKLLTDGRGTPGRNWNWDNNAEIAWAVYTHDANAIAPNDFNKVDPDNLVIQDLFIVADNNATTEVEIVNYFIRLEKYEISDYQAALAMVRNRSQS